MSGKIVKNKLSKSISSLSLDKEELKVLFQLLQERAYAACELEHRKVDALADPTINKELAKEQLSTCAVLKITVSGNDNLELFGSIDEVFDSVSFPEKVTSVYVHSEIPYKSLFNYYPGNVFQLLLDFSKPKIFDLSLQASTRTPNGSLLMVEGFDSTWVNGVFHEVDAFIAARSSKFPKVHKGSIYDWLVWFFGIPIGFWMCFRLSDRIASITVNRTFLANLIFVYVFFASLLIFRILFHYSRWVYPMVEYRSVKNKSLAHQAALISIVVGLIGSLIYDLLKSLL